MPTATSIRSPRRTSRSAAAADRRTNRSATDRIEPTASSRPNAPWGGKADAVVRASREPSGETPHTVPPPGRRTLRGRVVFHEGLLRRLLVALPRASADRDARRAPVEPAAARLRAERTVPESALPHGADTDHRRR